MLNHGRHADCSDNVNARQKETFTHAPWGHGQARQWSTVCAKSQIGDTKYDASDNLTKLGAGRLTQGRLVLG